MIASTNNNFFNKLATPLRLSEMIDYMTKIPNESIVDVECTFVAPSEPVTSCTQSSIELVLHKASLAPAE